MFAGHGEPTLQLAIVPDLQSISGAAKTGLNFPVHNPTPKKDIFTDSLIKYNHLT